MGKNIIPKLSGKETNGTLVPEELVSSYLVFGCIGRFSSMESKLPTEQQEMNAMQAARREMTIITAELRI